MPEEKQDQIPKRMIRKLNIRNKKNGNNQEVGMMKKMQDLRMSFYFGPYKRRRAKGTN